MKKQLRSERQFCRVFLSPPFPLLSLALFLKSSRFSRRLLPRQDLHMSLYLANLHRASPPSAPAEPLRVRVRSFALSGNPSPLVGCPRLVYAGFSSRVCIYLPLDFLQIPRFMRADSSGRISFYIAGETGNIITIRSRAREDRDSVRKVRCVIAFIFSIARARAG